MRQLLTTIVTAAVAVIAAACGRGNEEGLSVAVFTAGENGVPIYRIPAIVQAEDGTLIAFAEARNTGIDDAGDIDLVCKRSTDGGRTWSEMIMIWDAGTNFCDNPCPVFDESTGRLILLCNWTHEGDTEWKAMERKTVDIRRVFMICSDDNGLTWSEPKEITESAKDPEWTSYAMGPCHAIQLRNGPHRGRIVAPANHGVWKDGTESHVILSDDGGQTWRIGGLPGDGNESTVAELENGDVMLNMREFTHTQSRNRIVAVSHDGGETFDEPYYDKGLVEPVCNGALVNYNPDGNLTGTLLFCNPNDSRNRVNLTIRRSDDSGRTWRPVFLVDEIGAYCDLVVLRGGDLGVLYETGGKVDDYDSINFMVVPAGKL